MTSCSSPQAAGPQKPTFIFWSHVSSCSLYLVLNMSLFFRAKGLHVPGMGLNNVLMLETPEDARQIHAACAGSQVVLVGTSFVGTAFGILTRTLILVERGSMSWRLAKSNWTQLGIKPHYVVCAPPGQLLKHLYKYFNRIHAPEPNLEQTVT